MAARNDDPVAAALAVAPVDATPESEDERRKVAEARAAVAAGAPLQTHDDVVQLIEEMRRRQGG